MKRIISILILLTVFVKSYSQDLPKDYYAPYKTINYKETNSFGYIQYNTSPMIYSNFKVEIPNPSPYSSLDLYKKYTTELLSGFSNMHLEAYQYWETSKNKGFEFSGWITKREYENSFQTDYNPSNMPFGNFSNMFILTKSEYTAMLGKVLKEPLSMGVTLSSKSFVPVTRGLNDVLNMRFVTYGPYLRVGTAVLMGKDKRRFGIFETFGADFAGSSLLNEKESEFLSYINLYFNLRLFSTSKPIRQLGLIFTYFDFKVTYEYINNSKTEVKYKLLEFPLNFGIGLAW